MYTRKEKVYRAVLISLLIPILAVTAVSGYLIHKFAAQRVELKQDTAELNNIQYGLFSVDRWKNNITELAQEQIDRFKLNKDQEAALRESLDETLNALITQAVDMMNEKKKTLGGKLQKFAFKTFVNVDKVREKVPEFSETILKQIKNPKNKRKLKNLASDKLEELTEQTHETIKEKTEYEKIIAKYNITDPEGFSALANQRTEQLQQQIFTHAFYILDALIVFLLIWYLIRKHRVLYTPMFVLSVLLALIVLFVGLTVPMIEIDARIREVNFMLMSKTIVFRDQVLFFQSKSIMDVAHILLATGKIDSVLVGLLVLIFSIIFPITKLLCTKIYLLGNEKLKTNRFIVFFAFKSGKWSMADVMVVAIFMSYVGFAGILDSKMGRLTMKTESLTSITTNNTSLQPGFILFIAFVLFGLILSEILKRITKRYPKPQH